MYQYVKRLLDIVMASVALILLAPLFYVIILLIQMDSEGPVLFHQKRYGKNRTFFYIKKFRTMRIDTPKDVPTHLMVNPDDYITKVGRILRKTSLDELPQLLNILKGEMSLIGPRPALWNQDDLIQERDRYGANDIPVGLTGWAQVNGRDTISVEDKARFDGDYVKRMGPMMDIQCFVLTVLNVLSRAGVLEGGRNTVEAKRIEERYEGSESYAMSESGES